MTTTTITTTNVVTTTKTSIEVDAAVAEALTIFKEAKATIKQAKVAQEHAEEILRAAIGNAEFATIDGVEAFKITHRSTPQVNRKLLKEAFPEAYTAVLYDSPWDFVDTLI